MTKWVELVLLGLILDWRRIIFPFLILLIQPMCKPFATKPASVGTIFLGINKPHVDAGYLYQPCSCVRADGTCLHSPGPGSPSQWAKAIHHNGVFMPLRCFSAATVCEKERLKVVFSWHHFDASPYFFFIAWQSEMFFAHVYLHTQQMEVFKINVQLLLMQYHFYKTNFVIQ